MVGSSSKISKPPVRFTCSACNSPRCHCNERGQPESAALVVSMAAHNRLSSRDSKAWILRRSHGKWKSEALHSSYRKKERVVFIEHDRKEKKNKKILWACNMDKDERIRNKGDCQMSIYKYRAHPHLIIWRTSCWSCSWTIYSKRFYKNFRNLIQIDSLLSIRHSIGIDLDKRTFKSLKCLGVRIKSLLVWTYFVSQDWNNWAICFVWKGRACIHSCSRLLMGWSMSVIFLCLFRWDSRKFLGAVQTQCIKLKFYIIGHRSFKVTTAYKYGFRYCKYRPCMQATSIWLWVLHGMINVL